MIEKTVRWILILLASWHVLAAGWLIHNYFEYSAIRHVGEDISARIAYQVSTGFHGYANNSVQYDMLNYTPLYYQIQAQAIRWGGLDIRVQRFTVLLFGIGTILLVAAMVYHQTRKPLWAFLAGAFFTGINIPGWFIETNANIPCFFFAALALYILIHKPTLSWTTCLIVTLSLFCSFWSKQTGLAFLAAGLFCIGLKSPRKGAVCMLTAAVLIGAGTAYYSLILHAPFIFNVFECMSMEPMFWNRLLDPVLFPQITGRLGIITGLFIAGLLCTDARWRDLLKPEYIFLGAAGVSGIYCSLKYGSGLEHHILFYGLLIACALPLAARMIEQGISRPVLIFSLLAVQALAEVYDVRPNLITAVDQNRFEKILNILAAPGKRTQFYFHGYHSILIGKPSYVTGLMEPEDIYRHNKVSYSTNYINFWNSDPFDLFIIYVPLEANSQLAVQHLQRDFKPVGELPAVGNDREPRKQLVIFERKKN
jgi:hypothetical protein